MRLSADAGAKTPTPKDYKRLQAGAISCRTVEAMSSLPTRLRRTVSLDHVLRPSAQLVRLHGDYRRLVSAYDLQFALDADNEVALAMIRHDMIPLERQLADLLQREEPVPANAPQLRSERAVADAGEQAPSKRRGAKPHA
jgi:hypothetical protein